MDCPSILTCMTSGCHPECKNGGEGCIYRRGKNPHPEHAEGSRAEDLAKRFHEKYERLAPCHGYKTREKSAVPWEDVPKENKSLMIHVCTELLGEGMKEIRTALALMNSMILSGASHSDQSESVYHKAMEALDSHQ